MEVHCKVCGEVVSAENVNLATSVATCAACDVVFSAEKQLNQNTEPTESTLHYPLQSSDSIDIATFGDDLFITRRWRTPEIPIRTLILIAITLFFYFNGRGPDKELDTFFFVLIAFIPINVYTLLAKWLNSTQIIICLGELIVKHKPLPWWGGTRISTENITQLYCVENRVRQRGRPIITYRIHATLSNGRYQCILSGLPTYKQARCIEQALEQHLGIRDRHAQGEYRSPRRL